MKFKALHNFIVVKQEEKEEKSVGGIVLASAAEQPNHGLVIAAGPGNYDEHGKFHEMSVKAGDTVLFGKSSANNKITIDNEELLLLTDLEIFGVLAEADNGES